MTVKGQDMERTRHMVDISDYAWEKLERLAYRLGAAQYVYKGRPRYGKLIELAIEKLEDSTMEWTVEEVWVDGTEDAEDELDAYQPIKKYVSKTLYPTPVTDSKEWWLANPNITPIKASQAEQDMAQDMALYGNAYISADTGVPIKAKDITFKVSAQDTASDELAKLSETISKLGANTKDASKVASSIADSFTTQASEYIASGMAQYLANTVEDAILGEKQKKPTPPVTHVMWNASQPGYIELTGSITQALSAPQYDILRGFAYAAFAEFSSDDGENALSISVGKVPWNKLWISATYADPSKLLKKLPDVGESVAKRVEAWLLQGNFIGTGVEPDQKPAYNKPIW